MFQGVRGTKRSICANGFIQPKRIDSKGLNSADNAIDQKSVSKAISYLDKVVTVKRKFSLNTLKIFYRSKCFTDKMIPAPSHRKIYSLKAQDSYDGT
ncbi:hypothetical protein GCM10023206_15740 [Acinetobacter puyangensis]